LFASIVLLTQTPRQSSTPVEHQHLPPEQVSVAAQALPQFPQLVVEV